MNYFELTTVIKSELGILGSQYDETIKMYIDIGSHQIMRYTGSTGTTKVLLIIIKNFVVDKMKSNNNKFDEKLIQEKGLDEFFICHYKQTLDLYRRMFYTFKNTSKAYKQGKLKMPNGTVRKTKRGK